MTDQSDKNSSSDTDNKNKDGDEGQKQLPPTMLGWIVRIVSLSLFVAIVAVIAYHLAQPTQEVTLKVEPKVEDIRANNGEYLVPIEIVNDSSRTVRDLKIEVETGGAEPIEIDIALLGQRERITYVLGAKQPLQTVDYRIVSYEAP